MLTKANKILITANSAFKLSVVGSCFALLLRVFGWIGEPELVTLLIVLWFLCFCIYAFPSLKTLIAQAPGVKVEMTRIEEKQIELNKIEQRLRTSAVAIGKLTVMLNSFSGRWTTDERLEAQRNFVEKNLNELFATLDVDDDEIKKIMYLQEIFERFDNVPDADKGKMSEDAGKEIDKWFSDNISG